jgi:hypothetical protein
MYPSLDGKPYIDGLLHEAAKYLVAGIAVNAHAMYLAGCDINKLVSY